MSSEILTILMMGGMSKTEANRELAEMRKLVAEGEDPEELLYDIGLEPDYIWELI